MTEEKAKAIDIIEGAISSMRDSSFKCKEFCILLCSAFLTIFATVTPTPKMMIILCTPVALVFWLFDSFYLYKERIFRSEYKRIASTEYGENESTPLLFNTKLHGKGKLKEMMKVLFFSLTTSLFYFPLLAGSLIFGLILLL